MATEYIIEEEALLTQSSDITADKKYYPIIDSMTTKYNVTSLMYW